MHHNGIGKPEQPLKASLREAVKTASDRLAESSRRGATAFDTYSRPGLRDASRPSGVDRLCRMRAEICPCNGGCAGQEHLGAGL
jgi:hypothetical protein